MKKYIPVFGPQELFDGAENCDEYLVAVQHSVGQKTKVSFYPSLVEAFNYVTDFPPRGVVFHRAAMRRIINPPVWTKADEEAGKLPDVGAIVITKQHEGHAFEGEFVCEMTGNYWCIKIGDKGFSVNKKHIHTIEKPIETPEELAQRLRSEWVDNAQNKWDQSGAKGGRARS